MKKKNLFIATILVVFGAVNENIAQVATYSAPSGSAGNGGYYNTFIGYSAGSANGTDDTTTNYGNVAVGQYAGSQLNTTGNCFLGWSAGRNTVSGGNNVFMGASSGFNNTTGAGNVFIGTQAGILNISGAHNTFLGGQAGYANVNGIYNTFLGVGSGHGNISGNNNAAVGVNSGVSLTSGDFNVFMGYDSGIGLTTGTRNVIIGYKSGEYAGNGSNNVFLGYVAPIVGTSNSIILADGSGNQRFYIHNNGYAGIGLGNNNIPNNRLEIASGATSAGLRFKNLTSGSTSITNPTNKVLSVNDSGDVILVDDKQGTGSGTATTNILVSNTNTMTSTVNSIVANAPIVNTVVNTIASGELTTTVNGVSSTPITLPTSGSGSDTSIYINDGSIIPANTGNRVVALNNNNLVFDTSGTNNNRNKVYIGSDFLTGTPFPTTTGNYRLYVEGGVLTEKVKVALRSTANWADYVFANDYKLMPLNEVEAFVKTNKHLPGISSADKLVNEGLDLGEMQAKQMQKIEELTLYAIEQNKKIEKQEKEIQELKVLVKDLINRNK